MFPGHCFRRPGQRGAFAGCTSEKCPKQRGLRGCRPQSEALFGWAGATRGRVRGLRGAVMPGSPPALPCRPPSKPEVRGCRGGHCHLRGPSACSEGLRSLPRPRPRAPGHSLACDPGTCYLTAHRSLLSFQEEAKVCVSFTVLNQKSLFKDSESPRSGGHRGIDAGQVGAFSMMVIVRSTSILPHKNVMYTVF